MILDKNKCYLAMAEACKNYRDISKDTKLAPETIQKAICAKKNVRPKTVGLIANSLDVEPKKILADSQE